METKQTLTGVALNRDRREGRQHVLDLRTQELRRRAQRVPVLAELPNVGGDVLLLLGAHSKVRALEQVGDRLGNLDLARVRASDGVDEGRERTLRPKHGLRAHRCADLAEQRQVDGFVDSERADGRRERRAVENTQVLLRREGDGLDVVRGKRLARRHDAAPAEGGRSVEDADGGIADEQTGDVRERREICGATVSVSAVHRTEVVALTSRRRDASAEGHEWDDVFAEEGAHALNELPSDARVAADEGVHADEDRAADPGLRHARGGEGVQERERHWHRVGVGRQDSTLLVLEECHAKRERVAGARVRCVHE